MEWTQEDLDVFTAFKVNPDDVVDYIVIDNTIEWTSLKYVDITDRTYVITRQRTDEGT